jgi:hypothetical protein
MRRNTNLQYTGAEESSKRKIQNRGLLNLNRQVLKTKWSISVKRAEKCVFGWDEEEIGT